MAGVWTAVVTPDGRYAISGSFDRSVRIWELSTGRVVRTLAGHSDWIMGVAVMPDGRRIISVSQDSTLVMWELQTGKRLALLMTNAVLHCVALTPDGPKILLGDASGGVRIIDIVDA